MCEPFFVGSGYYCEAGCHSSLMHSVLLICYGMVKFVVVVRLLAVNALLFLGSTNLLVPPLLILLR